jgi:hypothetical protein
LGKAALFAARLCRISPYGSTCWIVSSTDRTRRTAAGAILVMIGPRFQVTTNPDDVKQQAEGIDVGPPSPGGILQREPTGMHEQQPQRPPQPAVDVQQLVGDGVHQKMAQRKSVGLQGPLAAPRAIRT